MILEYVPLLQLQRDLHQMPLGYDRFREYLRLMLNEKGDDVALPPLVSMNPMGQAHVTECRNDCWNSMPIGWRAS